MRKLQEQQNPESTLSKARDDEMLFILRGQDESTPKVILAWIGENLHCSDEKLKEAFECALIMRRESLKSAD